MGGARLRVNPVDAETNRLQAGAELRLKVNGMWRDAVVTVTDAVPVGLMTLPSLPDQPSGLLQADLSSIVVDQVRLEVAS